MSDPVTPNRQLRLPRLGKKPWKVDWDFNFTKLDKDVGDILRGTVSVGRAATIDSTALIPFIASVSGDLTGFNVPDGEIKEATVDHSGDLRFDIPAEPIFSGAPAGVNIILLAQRANLLFDTYGGIFVVRIENFSGSTLTGASISWTRKGWKITT